MAYQQQQQTTVTYGQPVVTATYQPAPTYQPATQTVVVTQSGYQDDGVARATILLIVGFFFFPVWWFACCGICRPGAAPLARILNIVSTILGLVYIVWVPIFLYFEISAIIHVLPKNITYYAYSYHYH